MPKMIEEVVEHYQAKMEEIPENILFYRDGVGENMLDLVESQEFRETKDILYRKYQEKAPKLTLIIVTKRIDDRFFLRENGRINNIPGGTVVDNTVIKKERFNFFL